MTCVSDQRWAKVVSEVEDRFSGWNRAPTADHFEPTTGNEQQRQSVGVEPVALIAAHVLANPKEVNQECRHGNA